MLLVCLCVFSTGCLRLGADAMRNFMPGSAMSPSPPRSMMVTDSYFDGTKHVAPLVLTPLAPIAILDLPLEIVWDILIIPEQLSAKAYRRRSELKMLANNPPVYMAEYGYFDEFKKRMRNSDAVQRKHTMAALATRFAQDPDKYRPYVDSLFSLDPGCCDIMLDSLDFRSETALTGHLFELGLRPADFPHEHAVFNAMRNLRNYLRPSEYYITKQLARIQLLLEHGCNPNSIPEYNCKYVRQEINDFCGESSLDMARNSVAEFTGSEKEAGLLKEIVCLLEKHGAKTAKELNLSPFYRSMKLKDFFHKRDLEHFKGRMPVATDTEKNEAMEAIRWSGASAKEFEPFCRLLLDDGIQFPLKERFYTLFPLSPEIMDFVEFAFANGLKISDYQDAPVIYSHCDNFEMLEEYDAKKIEQLKRLLRLGFNPNVLVHRGKVSVTAGETALSCLQWALTKIDVYGHTINGKRPPGRRRMIVEAIEIVKQYGGLSTEDVKKLQGGQEVQK